MLRGEGRAGDSETCEETDLEDCRCELWEKLARGRWLIWIPTVVGAQPRRNDGDSRDRAHYRDTIEFLAALAREFGEASDFALC
jgi:hypothetical protein